MSSSLSNIADNKWFTEGLHNNKCKDLENRKIKDKLLICSRSNSNKNVKRSLIKI